MVQLSANLGFLWTETSLTDAIIQAGQAGFHAVECHWPYAEEPEEISKALVQANLAMLGLNTRKGDVSKGENGLSAVPGREQEARQYIDEAIDYAVRTQTKNVHVMAGNTDKGDAAEQIFRDNLKYAAQQAKVHNITILIEPLNHRDVPSYHLQSVEQAASTIEAVGADNVKIMFDCYHIQILQGDIFMRAKQFMPFIGHIQFASVPERAEPDRCELNYPVLLPRLYEAGYSGYIGAEYKPSGQRTQDTLGWMKAYI